MASSSSARPHSLFIRPGPAWAWFPPRPFPALVWLRERLAVTGAAQPQPAVRPVLSAAARLDFWLRLLFSQAFPVLEESFLLGLRAELGRRMWSQARPAGMARSLERARLLLASEGEEVEQRRERLAAAVEAGLTWVEAPAKQLSHPVRSLLLRQEGEIGRCWLERASHPAAGTPQQEQDGLQDGLRLAH